MRRRRPGDGGATRSDRRRRPPPRHRRNRRHVFTPELIAYPRLPGTPALTFDPVTKETGWHIDRESPSFTGSVAAALAALHGTPGAEAAATGLEVASPDQVRAAIAADIDRVKQEVGVGPDLWRRWRRWLEHDASWPPFTCLVHGDFYPGHVLVDDASRATGVLDWTEAAVEDPSVDFASHLMVFGEAGLEQLGRAYEAAGGRTWPGFRAQVVERLAAAPVRYALFALDSGLTEHLEAAKAQLGVAAS